MRHRHRPFLPILLLLVLAAVPAEVLAWAETDDDDLIVDAPWRTMRDYVPVLFFAPELEGLSVIRQLKVSNWDVRNGRALDTIFQDSNDARLVSVPSPVTPTWRIASDPSPEPDVHRCDGRRVEIIDPLGRSRSGVRASEEFKSFWHYIARIPVDCLGTGARRGRPGVHFIRGEIRVQQSGQTPVDKTIFRVMRVAFLPRPLPRFEPVDRHYDVHIHTIAEQTRMEFTDADASRKAFGGPLAQVIEAAFALGLVDQQLENGNWARFRDLIATTDHNVFFSDACVPVTAGGVTARRCFDDGSEPLYGPTAATDGHLGEFTWYRENLGTLGAEEVTLEGAGNRNGDRQGSHYLLYGGPHVEGPWHGGHWRPPGLEFVDQGVPSSATLEHVHRLAAPVDAFGYAAHPFSSTVGWLEELRHQAIGTRDRQGSPDPVRPLVNEAGDGFIFKGLQIWNGARDFITDRELKGHLKKFTYSTHEKLDPFTQNQPPVIRTRRTPTGNPERIDVGNQLFHSNTRDRDGDGIRDHLAEREKGLFHYYRHLMDGLHFSFSPQPTLPRQQFIRKLYIAAGTDAHGDFNFETNGEALVFAEVADIPGVGGFAGTRRVSISPNAFGRVRTYTLTSERLVRKSVGPPPGEAGATPAIEASVEAYRHGNTILTSNPICKFTVDANCRHDSAGDGSGWHDARCVWENANGRIGGYGRLDGGGTALIVRDGSEARVRSVWDDLPTFTPNAALPERIDAELVHVVHGGNKTTARPSSRGVAHPMGERGRPHLAPLGIDVDAPGRFGNSNRLPQAVLMKASTTAGECVTNPVWLAPVEIDVIKSGTGCRLPAGALKVVLSFPMSMDATVKRIDGAAGGGGPFGAQLPQPDDQVEANPNPVDPYRGARVVVYPLDAEGKSVRPGIELTGDRRWSRLLIDSDGGQHFRPENARFSVTNTREIPCPSESWDSVNHRATDHPAMKAVAIVVRDLRDAHGNALNSIGRTYQMSGLPNPGEVIAIEGGN